MEIPMIILIQNLKMAKEILINIFITGEQRLTNIGRQSLNIVMDILKVIMTTRIMAMQNLNGATGILTLIIIIRKVMVQSRSLIVTIRGTKYITQKILMPTLRQSLMKRQKTKKKQLEVKILGK